MPAFARSAALHPITPHDRDTLEEQGRAAASRGGWNNARPARWFGPGSTPGRPQPRRHPCIGRPPTPLHPAGVGSFPQFEPGGGKAERGGDGAETEGAEKRRIGGSEPGDCGPWVFWFVMGSRPRRGCRARSCHGQLACQCRGCARAHERWPRTPRRRRTLWTVGASHVNPTPRTPPPRTRRTVLARVWRLRHPWSLTEDCGIRDPARPAAVACVRAIDGCRGCDAPVESFSKLVQHLGAVSVRR